MRFQHKIFGGATANRLTGKAGPTLIMLLACVFWTLTQLFQSALDFTTLIGMPFGFFMTLVLGPVLLIVSVYFASKRLDWDDMRNNSDHPEQDI